MGRVRAASLLTFASVFVACGAVRYSAAAPTWREEIDGVWRVHFTGSVRVQLPVELSTVAGDGVAQATVLNDVGIRFHDAQWRNGRLRLKAATPQGPMKLDARVEGGRLVGEWAADHAVGQFMIRGSLEGVRVSADELAPIRGTIVFDSIWDLIRRRHFDPAFEGPAWQAVRDELRPRAAAAGTQGEAYGVIRDMLKQVGTSHVSFHPVLAGSAAAPEPPSAVVEWRQLSAATGYIRIAHFSSVGAQLARSSAQLDSAFAALAHLPALLIDLRDNPGGNAGLAAALAEHLSREAVAVGVFASREGLTRRGVRSIDELQPSTLPVLVIRPVEAYRQQEAMAELGGAVMVMTGGGAGDVYEGRVGVLVNRGTHSTAEAVTAALAESGRATILGARTAGQMLAGRSAQVARGWQVVWPEYDYRTSLGTRVEGDGVAPHVELTGSGTVMLQRAQSWIEEQATR